MAQRVCVTGANGQAGRAVMRDLLDHGYEVAATDITGTRDNGLLRADLTDYGQALEVLHGAEAVVHLANIPAPGLATPAVTFNPFVALRFSNIMSPADYERFPEAWADPLARRWNLWGYIDERDAAAACRLALEVPAEAVAGSPSFIIAAADTVMDRPSADLLAEVFPGVDLTRDVGKFGTLLAIDRAREVLGFEPRHSWRDHVQA